MFESNQTNSNFSENKFYLESVPAFNAAYFVIYCLSVLIESTDSILRDIEIYSNFLFVIETTLFSKLSIFYKLKAVINPPKCWSNTKTLESGKWWLIGIAVPKKTR